MNDVSDKFATVSNDKTIRLWDSGDYLVKQKAEFKGNAVPLCSCFINDVIITGWSDGSIRSLDSVTGALLWTMNSAHRTGVTAATCSNNGVSHKAKLKTTSCRLPLHLNDRNFS